MKKVLTAIGFGLAVMALALTGCENKPAVSYKPELHAAVMQEPPSLDLHKTGSSIARQIGSGTIWEKLLTLNGDAEPVPELAERFEMSEDAATFTFYLRRGLSFHDGQTMDAGDVVASMNRWINGFPAAREMAGGSRFEKIDGHTVKITFTHPAASFPDLIAASPQAAVITTAEACAGEDEGGLLKQYIGTGPFKFGEWKPNQYILLEKFADYVPYGDPAKPPDGWAGYKAPKAERLYFDYEPDNAARLAGLETGRFDVNYHVTADIYEQTRNLPDVEMASYQAGTLACVFNHRLGLAANLPFRQAVNAAVNKGDMLRAAYGDHQYELDSSYMDGRSRWKSQGGSENYHIHDTAKAKALLQKAGYKGEVFRVLASTLNNMDKAAREMTRQLEAAGIKTELTVTDWAALNRYRTDPTRFDIYITSFAPVPLPSLKPYFSPANPPWSEDETLAKHLAGFNNAASREEAKAQWDILQAYSWEYLPLISAGHYLASFAWNKKAENLSFFNGLYFWNAGVRP